MKYFNVTGKCIPSKHYMVDITPKIKRIIEDYIAPEYYFTIHCGDLSGKTTIIYQLGKYLPKDFLVIFLGLNGTSSDSKEDFIIYLKEQIVVALEYENLDSKLLKEWNPYDRNVVTFFNLGNKISQLCTVLDKEVIFIIDDIDKAPKELMISLLDMMRSKYTEREKGKIQFFHNVIFTAVQSIPWNIAENFDVDMSFSSEEIATMLEEYESDYRFGMDIDQLSNEIYAYTSGYPYLVSQICKSLDEEIWKIEEFGDKSSAWCPEGVRFAVKSILELGGKNRLFYNLSRDLYQYPDLDTVIRNILLNGKSYPFTLADNTIQIGAMFGYLKEKDGKVVVANQIFEIYLRKYLNLNERR